MFKINNATMPAPKSVNYSVNKIWSQNTGRLDSGYFVGDLIAEKRKYEIVFPPLNAEELTTVKNAVNLQFATVIITNMEGATDTIQAYFGDFSVSAYSWHDGIKYAIDASVSVIER